MTMPYGLWTIVYSVAFKKPRNNTLKWLVIPSADNEIQASRIARSLLSDKSYNEYGIIKQLMLCHNHDSKDKWFQSPDKTPQDLDYPLEKLISIFSTTYED
jgi:hypothetical protein